MRRRIAPLSLAWIAILATATAASGQTLADYDYEYLGFRGFGVDIGYIWPDKVEATHQYGLRLDLGYLGPGIRVIPSLGYWRSQLTDQEVEDLETRLSETVGNPITGLGPIQWSDLSFSIDGQVVWNTPIRVLTFLGAGVAFHALNGQGASIDDTIVEDLLDTITAGVSALAGFEFQPVRRFRVYAEGRYTAMNSIQYLSARGGLQFMFATDGGVRVGAAVPAPILTGDEP